MIEGEGIGRFKMIFKIKKAKFLFSRKSAFTSSQNCPYCRGDYRLTFSEWNWFSKV